MPVGTSNDMRVYCEQCDRILAHEAQYLDHVGGKKHKKRLMELERKCAAAGKPRIVMLSLASHASLVLRSLGRLLILVLTPGMSGSLRSVMMCVFRFVHTVGIALIHPQKLELQLRPLRVRLGIATPEGATTCISGAVGAAEPHVVEGLGGIVPCVGELLFPRSLFFAFAAHEHCESRVGAYGGAVLQTGDAIAQLESISTKF